MNSFKNKIRCQNWSRQWFGDFYLFIVRKQYLRIHTFDGSELWNETETTSTHTVITKNAVWDLRRKCLSQLSSCAREPHAKMKRQSKTKNIHKWSLFLLVRNWADCYLIYLFFTSGRIAFFPPRLWCWAWNTCRYPKASWRTEDRFNKRPNQRTKTKYGDLSTFFLLPSRRYTDHYHICARTYMPSTYLSVCCYNFFFSYRFQPWNFFFSALSMLIIFDSIFFFFLIFAQFMLLWRCEVCANQIIVLLLCIGTSACWFPTCETETKKKKNYRKQ